MSANKRIVVKVGTSSVTHPNGTINLKFIDKLCAALTDLKNEGNDVILVTSGAVGVGKYRMNLQDKQLTISEKQAMAAIGQGLLLHIYEKNFLEYGQMSAQLLLTREDIKIRRRFLNARNTLLELLKLGVIPIVNENDSVANDEIQFGDNDTLAALVAVLSDADMAVLFTDIDGLYTANPALKKDAKKIDMVEKITEEIEIMAGSAISKVGTGGMRTKIEAAKIATNAGISMVVASRNEVGCFMRSLPAKRSARFSRRRIVRCTRENPGSFTALKRRGSSSLTTAPNVRCRKKDAPFCRAGSLECREILIAARSLPLQICREIALPKGSRIILPCSWNGSRA